MPDAPAGLLEDITGVFAPGSNLRISMLRLDSIHPTISGNKWFKLKHNLDDALAAGHDQLITFGGAYSNHLVAAAAAARISGLRAVGIVRGLHAALTLTPTLKACVDDGMQLHFLTREEYTHKADEGFLNALQSKFGRSYVIPEGGDNDAGRRGAGIISAFVPLHISIVCVPVGTGTTFAGLRNALPVHQSMLGFTAMRQGAYLINEIGRHLKHPGSANWSLCTDYALNGFGKSTGELIAFMKAFYKQTGIPLDQVYTGKMMYGVNDLINKGVFPDGAEILCIHTGGLQGNPAGLYTTL